MTLDNQRLGEEAAVLLTEVPEMFEDVLKFWLDRGVDGFRVDVAHGLFKEESLRDQVVEAQPTLCQGGVEYEPSLPPVGGGRVSRNSRSRGLRAPYRTISRTYSSRLRNT